MSEEQIALPTLPVGTLLRKRYQIRRMLASGRNGTIYLVKDQQAKTSTYQLFALKEIAGLDQQARYHLTVSSLPLRQLKHPVLPVVHTLFNDDKRGCVYVVMDYIAGVSIETLCRQRPGKRLSWSEVRDICEQVAGALAHLHLQDTPIYHGDLKPGCIVRTNAGKIILLGLEYGQLAGTEQARRPAAPGCDYCAPEQLSGTINARTDVYSLGAVLYELLTGQRPIDASTRMARIQKRRTDPLALASKIAPAVPRPLADILDQALALNPTERFPSIKAFWQTLSALSLHEEETLAPRSQAPTTMAPTLEAQALPSGEQTPAVKIVPVVPAGRSLLLLLALLCALLLLLAGLGTLLLAPHTSTQTSNAALLSPSVRPTLPVAGASPPLASPDAYANVTGKYTGYFYFFDQDGNATPHTPFTLTIDHQTGGQFTGIFDAPDHPGTVRGTTDQHRNVVWTVLDASGNATIAFSGGLNGIYDSQLNTKDSGGGTLTRCRLGHGPVCTVAPGPGNGGIWTLNLIPTIAGEPVPYGRA